MKPRILLAEHNAIDHFIICKMLTQLGCDVESAANGFLVVDAVRKNSYDLVFTSRHLALLDGLETMRVLRDLPEARALPVVMLLDDNHLDEVFLCIDAGISDFLTRPLAGHKFRATLKKWLGEFIQSRHNSALAIRA